MIQKILIFIATIAISIIFGGLFGIIHDQVTYTISNEYFTKFKFIQFGLADSVNADNLLSPRQAVAIVGFLATWWVGLFIGIWLGLTGLIFSDYKKMFKAILNALLIVFLVTIMSSFIGFLYGKFYLTGTELNWWLPDNLIDKTNFIIVGSIHNASYLGGLLGLISGTVYLVIKNRRQRINNY